METIIERWDEEVVWFGLGGREVGLRWVGWGWLVGCWVEEGSVKLI